MNTARVAIRSVCTSHSYNHLPRASLPVFYPRNSISHPRKFSVAASLKMPEPLKSSEVNSQTDPSVAKQYDTETSKEQQIKDLFNMIDGKKIGMLNTYRNGIGMLSRSRLFAAFC